jgi:hypothetical protein
MSSIDQSTDADRGARPEDADQSTMPLWGPPQDRDSHTGRATIGRGRDGDRGSGPSSTPAGIPGRDAPGSPGRTNREGEAELWTGESHPLENSF